MLRKFARIFLRLCSLALLGWTSASFAIVSEVDDSDRLLEFGCDDLVVVGRLTNGAYEAVPVEGEILGRGWTKATVRVRKVIKGGRLPASISIRYFSHAQIREDRDFMFVLRKVEGGGYELETGQLMSIRPKLADHCSPSST